MSIFAPIDLELYRQLKARALMQALAGQCRTPLEAVRFVFGQFDSTEQQQLQQVAEAALRTRSSPVPRLLLG